jgi:hypothetical protein
MTYLLRMWHPQEKQESKSWYHIHCLEVLWDGDFQVGQDLHSIVILNKVLKVVNDAEKLLGRDSVDDSNVHVDALVTNSKERNKKDMKNQGVNKVEDVSNNFFLWHLPFKIHEARSTVRH